MTIKSVQMTYNHAQMGKLSFAFGIFRYEIVIDDHGFPLCIFDDNHKIIYRSTAVKPSKIKRWFDYWWHFEAMCSITTLSKEDLNDMYMRIVCDHAAHIVETMAGWKK